MSEKDFQRKKNKFLPKIHAWYYFFKIIFPKVLGFVVQVTENPRSYHVSHIQITGFKILIALASRC
jgi:hypothetical protein